MRTSAGPSSGRTGRSVNRAPQRWAQCRRHATAAVGEQTQDVEQVGLDVKQIDRTTQQNAALAEESAAAAASLRTQSERLAEAVAAFRADAMAATH